MAEFVTEQVRGQVATITLNRPDLHNAFNDEMMREVSSAFGRLGAADDIRAIVFAAAGKSFCAGADLNWMQRMVNYTVEENIADAHVLTDMLSAIRDCPTPVIGRVHGACFGGGVGLVAACDIAVGLARAKFCLSEVKLGIIPAVISPYLMEKIGLAATQRYALTAERFDAAEALRLGLLSEVVEDEVALDARIDALTEALRANGPHALAACKRLLKDVAAAQQRELRQLTAERIAEIRVSAEGQEGLKAFLEKRAASWVQ